MFVAALFLLHSLCCCSNIYVTYEWAKGILIGHLFQRLLSTSSELREEKKEERDDRRRSAFFCTLVNKWMLYAIHSYFFCYHEL